MVRTSETEWKLSLQRPFLSCFTARENELYIFRQYTYIVFILQCQKPQTTGKLSKNNRNERRSNKLWMASLSQWRINTLILQSLHLLCTYSIPIHLYFIHSSCILITFNAPPIMDFFLMFSGRHTSKQYKQSAVVLINVVFRASKYKRTKWIIWNL